MGKVWRKSWGGGSGGGGGATSAPSTPQIPSTPQLSDYESAAGTGPEVGVKTKSRRKGKAGRGYSFDSNGSHDILGIVMLEILKAEDLPRLKNSKLYLSNEYF
jgi:phosphatidylserine decarboxylase